MGSSLVLLRLRVPFVVVLAGGVERDELVHVHVRLADWTGDDFALFVAGPVVDALPTGFLEPTRTGARTA